MKISRITPPVPKPTYVVELTEDELMGLRALAFNSSDIEDMIRSKTLTTGNLAQVENVLVKLWGATSEFLPEWRKSL